MMSEPKGRSGKKPKYQIADIGGSDLTSEDISTERVLNFLIKGEVGSVEQGGGTDDEGAAPSTDVPTSTTSTKSSVRREDVSSEPKKKSLSHLFERASSGGGAPAKDLKLNLSESQPSAAVPFPAPTVQEQTVTVEDVIEVERVEVSWRAEVSTALPEPEVAPLLKANPKSGSQPAPSNAIETTLQETRAVEAPPIAATTETTSELSHYVELWKNFYRLNSGEIDALSVMFRMSHDEGRSDCHVKMRKLAEMSSLDYRYCQKVVRSLERLGWITKLQDYDPATQLGVLYRVNLKPTVNLNQ